MNNFTTMKYNRHGTLHIKNITLHEQVTKAYLLKIVP